MLPVLWTRWFGYAIWGVKLTDGMIVDIVPIEDLEPVGEMILRFTTLFDFSFILAIIPVRDENDIFIETTCLCFTTIRNVNTWPAKENWTRIIVKQNIDYT